MRRKLRDKEKVVRPAGVLPKDVDKSLQAHVSPEVSNPASGTTDVAADDERHEDERGVNMVRSKCVHVPRCQE